MRVIAGEARRLQLKTTPGFDTRPTTDRIKETLFNILSPDIPGCRFLDLYAGSGGIGIEALSRGAVLCVFVDKNPRAVRCINDNLAFTGLADRARVLQNDVLSGIRNLSAGGSRFDVIYIDPPYQLGLEEATLSALSESGLAGEYSRVILEADINTEFGWISRTGFELVREKVYKTNKHLFLKIKNTEKKTDAKGDLCRNI